MELRQLRYFMTVGQMSSITRAAEQLHTSQPNITTAIQKLESELGVPLFYRKQKRLHLTREGRQFLSRIETVIGLLEEAISEVTHSANLHQGRVRIGIPPSIGAVLFPDMLSRFSDLHPDIELAIVEDGSWSIAGKIEAAELDLAIMILTDNLSMNTIFLDRQQVMVCLPVNHHLASKQFITFVDLKDESLILLGEHSYHHHIIIREFERLKLKPHIVLSTNQVETIKGLVANNIGVSFLFEDLVRTESDIVSKPFASPMFVDIALAWKKGGHVSAATQAFIDFFKGTKSYKHM